MKSLSLTHSHIINTDHIDNLSSTDCLNSSAVLNICQVNIVHLQYTVVHPENQQLKSKSKLPQHE